MADVANPDEVAEDAALAAAAAPLYALPPEEFVEARDARARQARSCGDRDLARRVTALPKPTVAAHLLNELARRRPDAVEQLAGLGGRLRAAQESLDGGQMRALTRQRQEVVAAFARQVSELARELGRPLSDAVAQQVHETLRAAVADDGAGRALRSGRLTTALEYVGMGEVDVSVAMAAPRAPLRAPEPAEPLGEVAGEDDELASARRRRRDAVARALTEAEGLAQAAADRLSASDRQLRDAQEAAAGLHDRVARLRTELDRAVEAAEAADDEVQQAAQEQADAATDAAAARDVVERARADLDESP